MLYTTPDKLTAAMLTRITAGGTIAKPADLPHAPTHYRQIGQLFYPQVSAVFARVAARYGNDSRGDQMAGYMAVALASRSGGAAPLHDMARLELALADMHPGPLAQAQAAIVAYMCGAVGETNPGAKTVPPPFFARRMLALTVSETL